MEILFIFLFLNLFLVGKVLATGIPIISADFNDEIAPINDQVFGQGLEIPFLKNVWDKDTGFDQEKIKITQDMGFTNVRFGGNTCKQFNWKEASSSGFTSFGTTYYENIDQWSQYAALLGDEPPIICVNLHLTPQDSADMVRYANIDHSYNIKNWEMGNEEYIADQYQKYTGAEEYINDARAHCQAMKAVDQTIKCGIHAGFSAGGPAWTDDALFSAVRPGDFDFLVNHNYQPNGYYNYLAMLSAATKVDQDLNLESGVYKIGFHAIGQQAPLIPDPIPTMQVCLGDVCQLVDITGTTSDWYYYSTDNFTIDTATGAKLKMQIYDDYYDYSMQQDKNIFLADVRVVNENGSIRQSVELVDRKAWTYSFLASNLTTEDDLDHLRNKMQLFGLILPIYETEYGWQYGGIAYPKAGGQYDWRSGLFDALSLQSLINKKITQANLWTDPSVSNWRFYTNDEKGQIYWPRYYAFKLMKEKTGDIMVKVDTTNMPTYDAQEFTTQSRSNVPYLSIIASKKGDKNYINVINRDQDNPITATIKTNSVFSSVVVYEIAPSSIEAHPYRNDQYKENVTVNETILAVRSDFDYSFKPFSITTFEFIPPDTIAPVLTSGLPSGQLSAGTVQATMQLETDEDAVCRYSTQAGLSFASSTNAFSTTGSTAHSSIISGLGNGNTYNYFVRCQDTIGNETINDYIISFSVAQPVSSGGGGGGGGSSANQTNVLPKELAVATTSVASNSLPIIQEKVEVLGMEDTVFSGYKSLYGLNASLADAISQSEAETVTSQTKKSVLSEINRKKYEKIITNSNKLSDGVKYAVAYFIQTGTPTTQILGSGERAGVLNSYISAFGSVPETIVQWQDVIKIANGRWPAQNSRFSEDRASVNFKKIYLRIPDMKDPHDNAAVNIVAYGLRPVSRNTNSEKAGVVSFIRIFGHNPISAIDWDIVRSVAYSGAKR